MFSSDKITLGISIVPTRFVIFSFSFPGTILESVTMKLDILSIVCKLRVTANRPCYGRYCLK